MTGGILPLYMVDVDFFTLMPPPPSPTCRRLIKSMVSQGSPLDPMVSQGFPLDPMVSQGSPLDL